MTFQELGLCPPILSALRNLGYQKPSPIQEKAIPPALKGRDVLGCAQTGTGKTCAFATPILQQLNNRPVKGRPIRALILTPTRELALQIQESFEAYGKNLPLRSAVIFGGVGQQPQVDALKRGVDILVATPGRLEDLHNQGYIHVENLEIFVLDEADRMLDMGFIHDVRKILKWIPQKKQTLFFSATMPPEVQHLVDSLLVNPVKVAVDPVSSPVEVIDQRLFYVDRGNKSKLLAMLVGHPDVKNALVFTRTKHGANKVAGDLSKAGIPSAAIHGNKSQTARQQALADFKAGRVKALVATDIAARGLDIEELSHVFNYNLPDVPETYVHRIGRTGRAGHGGTAVSFCEFGEKELLGPIEKLLKKPIPVVEGHPFPMEVFEAPKRDKHGKIVNSDDDEARQAARERKKQREDAKKAAPQPQKPKQEQKTPEWSEKRPGHAANASVTSPRPQPHQAQPKQGKQPQTPQTSAAGKRASAGYKPSKTLDEALTAMAPRSPLGDRTGRSAKPNDGPHQVPGQPKSHGKQQKPYPTPKKPEPVEASPVFKDMDPKRRAEYEAWLAQEREIQKKYYRDALEGEEIMDATARLLAPKGSVTTASAPWQVESLRPQQPKPQQSKPTQRQANPAQPSKAKPQQGKVQQPKPIQPPKVKAQQGKPQPSKPKVAAPQKQPKPAPAPQPKQRPQSKVPVTQKQPKPTAAGTSLPLRGNDRPGRLAATHDRPGSPRAARGPVEAPRSIAQKDSTEQQSLMKPYYFNPNEED